MSRKNVELQRRYIDAFNARDVEAFIACCDQNIEFHSVFAAVGGAVYHGHDGLRTWHRDFERSIGAAWERGDYGSTESMSFQRG